MKLALLDVALDSPVGLLERVRGLPKRHDAGFVIHRALKSLEG